MDPQAAADWLYRSIKARDVLADPPQGLSATLADSYAVQEALIARMEPDGGPVAGWKVTLTSPVMQQMCGVDHPCEGAVLRNRIHQSPAECDTATLGRPGVEAEIALVIGQDMTGASGRYIRESAAACIVAAHAAIELVDDRNANYARITAAKLIANNSLNAGIVLGPAVPHWRQRDLASLKDAMLIDGQVAAEGTDADILGHPLNAFVWLANSLDGRGKWLRKGDVVMCGSFVRTQFHAPGQTVTSRVEALGEASVAVR